MTIRALWPIRRETPVTRLATQEMVTLIGVAAASPERTRRVVGVATGINACPCAIQGLVRGRASERLLEAGFGEEDVERILEETCHWRRTISAGAGRCSLAPRAPWTQSISSTSWNGR